MYSTKYSIHAVHLVRRYAAHYACHLTKMLGSHIIAPSKRWLARLGVLRLVAELCLSTTRSVCRLVLCAPHIVKTSVSYAMILAWLLAFGVSSLASASTLASLEDTVPIVMTAPAHVLPYPQPLCSKCKALVSLQTDIGGTQIVVLSLGRDVLPPGFVGQIRVTTLFSGNGRNEEIFDVAIVEDELTLTLTEPVGASWQTLELLWVELVPTA